MSNQAINFSAFFKGSSLPLISVLPCPANFRRDPFFSGTKQGIFFFPPQKSHRPSLPLPRKNEKKTFGRNFHLPSPFFSLPTHQQHSMPLYTTARSTTTVSHYPLGLYSPPPANETVHPAHTSTEQKTDRALFRPFLLLLYSSASAASAVLLRPPLPPSPSSSSSPSSPVCEVRGEETGGIVTRLRKIKCFSTVTS